MIYLKYSATHGDAFACFALYLDYLKGTNGFPKNDYDASIWLKRSADRGVLAAQYTLSKNSCNMAGEHSGVITASCKKSLPVLGKIANGNSQYAPYAALFLVRYYEHILPGYNHIPTASDCNRGNQWSRRILSHKPIGIIANTPYINLMETIADNYRHGVCVKKNTAKAIKYYQIYMGQIESSNCGITAYLGKQYYLGDGVSKNGTLALYYWKRGLKNSCYRDAHLIHRYFPDYHIPTYE
jgi:TPR repeat protein